MFLKHRHDFRLKYVLISIAFLCSFFHSRFNLKIIYNDVKLCHQIEVSTPEYLNTHNKFYEAFLSSQFTVLTILQLKQRNNKSFYDLLIILSGDLISNQGPVYKYQLLNMTEWDIFKTKGLHLMHLNINSLLPKLDELRYISRVSNAAVTGISA